MGGERSDRKDFRKDFSKDSRNFTPSQSNIQTTSGNADLKKQIEAMNVKLDKLISTVHELTIKGALKEVTTESKETPKVVAPTKVIEKMKKVKKVK
jgi:hypothetical protein